MLALGLNNWISLVNSTMIWLLAYYMIISILFGIFRNQKFSNYMSDVKVILLIIIFGVLTNLTSWYLSWLFIPIFWLKPREIKSILWLQFLYELTYVYLCFTHSDAVKYQVMILPFIFIIMVIRKLIILIIEKRRESLNCKKMKNLS